MALVPSSRVLSAVPTRLLVPALVVVFALAAHAFPAHANSSDLPNPNSSAVCQIREEMPARFRRAGQYLAAKSVRGDQAGRSERLIIDRVGSSLLVKGADVVALVSLPLGSRGGGFIEGVSHRLSGGDLIRGDTGPGNASAWRICLGTRRTNPDSCSPEGSWVDSGQLAATWGTDSVEDPSTLRFTWRDETQGLMVVQQLELAPGGAVKAHLSASSTTTSRGIVSVHYPMIAIDYRRSEGQTGELLLPRGNLGIKCWSCSEFVAMYPGIYQTMPWFGALKGSHGLYVGAHDPSGGMKRVVASGPRGRGISYFEIYPEESGAPGNQIDPEWSFEIAPVCAARGWPAVAHRYKEWVERHTEWGGAERLIERTDIPTDLRDGAWWFVHSVTPDSGIGDLEELTVQRRGDFPGLPTMHHWYGWHTPGMDRGFPSHLPKPGTREAVERLQRDPGTRILLFTNATHSDQSTAPREYGRPSCPNGASQYPRYWHDTLQRPDRTRVFVVPGSNACLAEMDLSSDAWKSAILANSDLVTERLRAAGVYLDVIGGVDEGSWSSVRHPPGRGSWVTRAARDLVRLVSSRPGLVVVEGALEQMTGISTAGVNYLGSTEDMVPLFPFVHHERFILAGMISLPPDDDHDALRMKNGLAFAWGLQMGLNSLQWSDPGGPSHVAWAKKLLSARRKLSNWLAYGRYLGPVAQLELDPMSQVVSQRWGAFIDGRPVVTFRRNPVEASLYEGADGQMAVILINLAEAPATARLELPPPYSEATLTLSPPGTKRFGQKILSPRDGVIEVTMGAGEILRGDLALPASGPAIQESPSAATGAAQ